MGGMRWRPGLDSWVLTYHWIWDKSEYLLSVLHGNCNNFLSSMSHKNCYNFIFGHDLHFFFSLQPSHLTYLPIKYTFFLALYGLIFKLSLVPLGRSEDIGQKVWNCDETLIPPVSEELRSRYTTRLGTPHTRIKQYFLRPLAPPMIYKTMHK